MFGYAVYHENKNQANEDFSSESENSRMLSSSRNTVVFECIGGYAVWERNTHTISRTAYFHDGRINNVTIYHD